MHTCVRTTPHPASTSEGSTPCGSDVGTEVRWTGHKCAQSCTGVHTLCTSVYVRTLVHRCAQVFTLVPKCAASLCTSVHICAQVCTLVHNCAQVYVRIYVRTYVGGGHAPFFRAVDIACTLFFPSFICHGTPDHPQVCLGLCRHIAQAWWAQVLSNRGEYVRTSIPRGIRHAFHIILLKVHRVILESMHACHPAPACKEDWCGT